MEENSLLHRLDGIESRFEEVSTLISDPSVIADMKRYVRLNKEYHDLERLVGTTKRYRTLLANISEAREALESENDPEMRQMAKEQLDEAAAQLPEVEQEIKLLLTLMWPVRIAAAGRQVTPGGAVEICHILGREETLRRLRLGLEKL